MAKVCHLEWLEPIFHIYAPGAIPENIHLDNFNRQLSPFRIASSTVFLDDLPDGGTVFPLMLRYADSVLDDDGAPHVLPTSSAAVDEKAVEQWNLRLNQSRLDPGLPLKP